MKYNRIPFNIPYITGNELPYVAAACAKGNTAGGGEYTQLCHARLEDLFSVQKALLTHSCTAALEMAAILLNTRPGDEIIMPSFTFVTTANAFVLRGGIPVFVDIRPDTMNIDENLIEEAITEKTKAIVPVHYAGASCEMDVIMDVAGRHGLMVIEDAAQGILSTYKGRPLGSFGAASAVSFHETKNILCGEGGAILVNSSELFARAEIIREKGTDRSRFFRGQVDKYSWRDIGSSFLPSELSAAFLLAQLESSVEITSRRKDIWAKYHALLEPLEREGLAQRPCIPEGCEHNAHLYYLILPQWADRDHILQQLRGMGIHALFHYVPLHLSEGGRKFARTHGSLHVTENQAERLIRLPLWIGITPEQQLRVVESLGKLLRDAFEAGAHE